MKRFNFFLREGNFLLKFEDMEIKNFFFYQMNETAFVLCSTSVPNFFHPLFSGCCG